jgi:hypothetical protein
MGSESATISAVTIVLFCTTAAPAVAHGAAVALGSDGFVAVVMAAIVRHRPAIHGEGVGSRRWAYGAVSVDMHTQGAGLRAQRPGGLFLGRRRTKRRRRCSTRPRYQAHTVPYGVASLDAALSVLQARTVIWSNSIATIRHVPIRRSRSDITCTVRFANGRAAAARPPWATAHDAHARSTCAKHTRAPAREPRSPRVFVRWPPLSLDRHGFRMRGHLSRLCFFALLPMQPLHTALPLRWARTALRPTGRRRTRGKGLPFMAKATTHARWRTVPSQRTRALSGRACARRGREDITLGGGGRSAVEGARPGRGTRRTPCLTASRHSTRPSRYYNSCRAARTRSCVRAPAHHGRGRR